MAVMERRAVAVRVLLLTAVIEGVTALARFGFGLESTRDTASTIGVITGGLRIHHGYVGLLFLAVCFVLWRRLSPRIRAWVLVVGLALTASDLVHHFVVLNLVVGDPGFDLFY